MDALSVLFNAMWQDAQRPRRRSAQPNSIAELKSYARRLQYVPRLVYSTVAWRWFARDRIAVSSELNHRKRLPAARPMTGSGGHTS